MRFLMFVASDSEPDPEREAPGEVETWVDTNDRSGTRIMGERLRPAGQAKTVRVRGGKVLVTDGPFAEAKEVIVGFDILECADMDEAITVAAAHPMARAGRLELRAFWPFEG